MSVRQISKVTSKYQMNINVIVLYWPPDVHFDWLLKCRVSSKTIDITFLPLLPTTEVQSLDALGTHIRKYFKFSKVTSE